MTDPRAVDEAPLLLGPIADETSDRRRAVRVGVVAVIGIAFLVAALLVTGPLSIVRGPTIRVDFSFCGPIKVGASVRLAGIVVGVVEDVELLAGLDPEAGPDAMVRVTARVKDDVAHLLTPQTRFYVTTLGVLGEHYLDIAPAAGAKGTPLPNGARVDGVALARADLLLPRASALLEQAETLLPGSPELQRLMSATTSLVTALDGILADPAQQAAAADDVKAARQLLGDLSALVAGARRGVGDGGALRATLTALPGVLEKTGQLEDQVLAADVTAILRDLHRVGQHADGLITTLEQGPVGDVATQKVLVTDLQRTLRSLDAAARSASLVLRLVDDKRGAGKLLVDDAFADDLKEVVRQVREDPMKLLFK